MPGIFAYLIPFNLCKNEVYTILFHFTNEEAGKFFKKQINLLKATCQDQQDSSLRCQTPKLILSILKGCI